MPVRPFPGNPLSRLPWLALLAAGVIPWLVAAPSAQPQASDPRATSAQTYEWPSWGGDERSSRYAPLDQINAGNFRRPRCCGAGAPPTSGHRRTSSTARRRST
jgi:hypothetical protein